MRDIVRVDQIPESGADTWAVKGVCSGMAVLWGKTGSYKTFTAISMAVAVAAGKPWFGCKTHQGPVLYVLGEGGDKLFQRRVTEIAREMGIGLAGLPLYLIGEALDLSTPAKLEEFWGKWDLVSPTFVVVDTLSRCLPGDENKQDVMQGFVAAMDAIRTRYDATVLILHHANKGGEVRGSTVLTGAADVVIKVNKAIDGAKRVAMYLAADKLRDMDVTAFPHSQLYPRTVAVRTKDGRLLLDEFGDKVTTVVMSDSPEYRENVIKVFEVFRILEGGRDPQTAVGYKEWLEESCAHGMSAATFKRALATLLSSHADFGVYSPSRGQYRRRDGVPRNPLDPSTYITLGSNYDTEEGEDPDEGFETGSMDEDEE